MPYTQAVLLEIMRYATPVPVTSRSPLEDNEINGDFIPKVISYHSGPDSITLSTE